MPLFPVVEREAPIAALDTPFLRDLAELQKEHKTTKQLSQHLAQAAEQLTLAAESLNGRGTDYQTDVSRKRRRAEQNGEELDPDVQENYVAFREQVEELTKRLDHGVRNIVDDQAWVDSIPSSIKDISDKAAASNLEARHHLSRQAAARENADDSASQLPEDMSYLPPPRPDEVPSSLLNTARHEHKASWAAQSLTARYSENNTYVGFYRMVHDAKQPADTTGEDENGEARAGAAPLPHHSIWFAAEEDVTTHQAPSGTQSRSNPSQPNRGKPRNPNKSQQTPNPDPDSESDPEIAGETISLRCPITLLPFADPITSTKCPHSFSRSAFDALFATSADRVLTPAQTAEIAALTNHAKRAARTRELKRIAPLVLGCPVCNEKLERGDVKPDLVLRRRVEREQERERRERERELMDDDVDDIDDGNNEDDEEEGRVTKSQRKSAAGTGRAAKVKTEPARRPAAGIRGRVPSRVPDTQLDGAEDDDDEDEEEEHDEMGLCP